MGLFEKRRFRNMLLFIQGLEEDNQQTWKSFNIRSDTMMVGYRRRH